MPRKASENNAEQGESKTELWISRSFAQHSIVVDIDGKGELVKFEDYKLPLDLENDHDKKVSTGLRRSNRFGRDIFVVGEKYDDNEIGKHTEMLKVLREMDVQQLRSLVTLDELIKSGIPANTTDADELITYILRNKSLEGIQ